MYVKYIQILYIINVLDVKFTYHGGPHFPLGLKLSFFIQFF